MGTLSVPLAALLGAVLVLGGCSESLESLEDRVQDKPGVTEVSAGEGGGDNDIPFATIPKHVEVRMAAEASAEEVIAVFDAYDDLIDEGEVVSVEVVLGGSKEATLASGEQMEVTPGMVDDLLAAQEDDTVVAFRREVYPGLPGVRAELEPAGFAEVVAFADRYSDVEGIEIVEVVSGPFLLIRDEVNADQQVTSAREELAHLVDTRFGLLGASVSGRGPLELVVAPEDVAAVRRLVDLQSDPTVGRVRVESAS